jgi:hypothetical protein
MYKIKNPPNNIAKVLCEIKRNANDNAEKNRLPLSICHKTNGNIAIDKTSPTDPLLEKS